MPYNRLSPLNPYQNTSESMTGNPASTVIRTTCGNILDVIGSFDVIGNVSVNVIECLAVAAPVNLNLNPISFNHNPAPAALNHRRAEQSEAPSERSERE